MAHGIAYRPVLLPEPFQTADAACKHYSRAYLHHAVKANEIIASMLLTAHNLTFYQQVMAGLRAAIASGTIEAWAQSFFARYGARGDSPTA